MPTVTFVSMMNFQCHLICKEEKRNLHKSSRWFNQMQDQFISTRISKTERWNVLFLGNTKLCKKYMHAHQYPCYIHTQTYKFPSVITMHFHVAGKNEWMKIHFRSFPLYPSITKPGATACSLFPTCWFKHFLKRCHVAYFNKMID